MNTGRILLAVLLAASAWITSAHAQSSLYQSPIPDTMNVRFIENHIVIDRPAKDVFAWVTTWGNLPKWLPVTYGVATERGELGRPSRLGDVLVEHVNPANTTGIDKRYTVVALLDGFLWTVAGQDIVDGKPNERIQYVATYAVSPLDEKHCLYTRVFQTIRPDAVNPAERRAVDNPEIIQRGLASLKRAVEAELPAP